MAANQIFLLVLLISILVLFAWGRWRYDIIAFTALIVATLAGMIPSPEMFYGFAHPATVTVALVLVISRGLRNSGAVTLIARHVLLPQQAPIRQVGLCAGVGALLSTVMNNVGALALLMPAALQSAGELQILMGVLFGLLLTTPFVAASMVIVKMAYIEDVLGDHGETSRAKDLGTQRCCPKTVGVREHLLLDGRFRQPGRGQKGNMQRFKRRANTIFSTVLLIRVGSSSARFSSPARRLRQDAA